MLLYYYSDNTKTICHVLSGTNELVVITLGNKQDYKHDGRKIIYHCDISNFEDKKKIVSVKERRH